MEDHEQRVGRSFGEKQEDMERNEAERIADKYDPKKANPEHDQNVRQGMETLKERQEHAVGASAGRPLDDLNDKREFQDWKIHHASAEFDEKMAAMEGVQAAGSGYEVGQSLKAAMEGTGPADPGELSGKVKETVEHARGANDYLDQAGSEKAQAESIREGWQQRLEANQAEERDLTAMRSEIDWSNEKLKQVYGREYADHKHAMEDWPSQDEIDRRLKHLMQEDMDLQAALKLSR